MKNLLLLIFFTSTQLTCFFISSFGQGWERIYGEQCSYGRVVLETSDQHLIVAGYTNTAAFLQKFTKCGEPVWNKFLGPSEAGGCFSSSRIKVCETENLGFILVFNSFIVKTDTAGEITWQMNDNGFNFRSIEQTYDGNFIVAGFKTAAGIGADKAVLRKINTAGQTIWEQFFGGFNYAYANDVTQTSDGGYIITGGSRLPGASNPMIYLCKTDSSGNFIWEKVWNGFEYGVGNSIKKEQDGSYYLTCSAKYAGKWLIYLEKIDSSGNSEWTKSINAGYFDRAEAVPTNDGGFVVAGNKNNFSSGTKMDVVIYKMDAAGNTIWSKIIGKSGDEGAFAVTTTIDNGYIVVGDTGQFSNYRRIYLIKTDSLGNICYPSSLSQSPNICFGDSFKVGSNVYYTSGTFIDTLKTKYGGCDSVITTYLTVLSPPAYFENFLIDENQATSSCDSFSTINEEIGGEGAVRIFPNPSLGIFTLALNAVEGQSSMSISSITITNLIGEKVFEQKYPQSSIGKTPLSVAEESPLSAVEGGIPISLKQQKGIYFLEVELYSKKENTIRSRSMTKIILQ